MNGLTKWLKEAWAPTYGLPQPTRPAPPMPECKPPKAEDISEPVITLLEELTKDVWDVGVAYPDDPFKGWRISHHRRFVSFEYCFKYGEGYTLTPAKWMTPDEYDIVKEAVRVSIASKFERDKIEERAAFAKLIGAPSND